jgi:hypothetical protein
MPLCGEDNGTATPGSKCNEKELSAEAVPAMVVISAVLKAARIEKCLFIENPYNVKLKNSEKI